MFRRKYIKLHEEKEIIDKIKNEKLESNDIKAIIIAMMQVALPLALGIAVIYYLILLFLTKVWL
ncbi:MAG: hypothetical protein ACI398_03690 [Clostridium sp.]